MKNFILGAALAASTLLPFAKPAEAAYDAGIYIDNDCDKSLYVYAEWYDEDNGYWRSWSDTLAPNSWADYADFYIWGNHEFYLEVRTSGYYWDSWIDTYEYNKHTHTHYC